MSLGTNQLRKRKKSNDSEAIVVEEQHYKCAICWAIFLREMKVQGNMLFLFLFFFFSRHVGFGK